MNEINENEHLAGWQSYLETCREAASHTIPLLSSGHLTRINGLVMEASGLKLPLGSSCRILPAGGSPIEAEVVGFNGERLFLMPSVPESRSLLLQRFYLIVANPNLRSTKSVRKNYAISA